MREVSAILLGAGGTVVSCWAAGWLLLGALRVRLARGEHALVAFLAGAAAVSLAVFALCALHLARPGVFAAGMAAVTAAAVWRSWKAAPGQVLPALPKAWRWLFIIVFSAFTALYLFNSMAPECSPDGVGYHLDNVAHYHRAHGFDRSYDNMYYHLSQGIEMLFLAAFSLGRHSAAAMVHFAFLVVLPLLMLCYARRFGLARPGVFAALLVYASPVVGIAGTSAYNDVAVAAVLFGVFYLLQVWDQERNGRLLCVIGLLCGFGYAIKYTAAIAVLFALGFVLWRCRRTGRPWLAAALAVCACAALSVAPWMLKNWIWTGNPVAPLFNAWFPNPHVHILIEEDWRTYLRTYNLPKAWMIPFELILHGRGVGGVLGPVFLLSPLALLALRHHSGRRLLAGAAVFAVPVLMNTGTRFTIPALPCLTLALGLALARSPGVLPVLAVLHAVLSWPHAMPLYCDRHTWRLSRVPVTAALRIVPANQYLVSRNPDFKFGELLEAAVPPGQAVFSFTGLEHAYLRRDVLVSYTSARANLINDWLQCPIIEDFRPDARTLFRMSPRVARGVRVVQTGRGDSQWTVNELRIYAEGRELPRDPRWRLRAHPNPWEVQLAFDNSYVTRWLSYQRRFPGMSIEVRFGAPVTIDSVALETSKESATLPVKLEVQDEGGVWRPAGGEPTRSLFALPSGLRRAATLELAARGIHFVVVRDGSDSAAADMRAHVGYWGMEQVAEHNGIRLYRIQ